MRMQSVCILLLAAAIFPNWAIGATDVKLKIHGVYPDSSIPVVPGQPLSKIDLIDVVFETPVPIPSADVAFNCGDQNTINPWHIVLYDKQGTPQILDEHMQPHIAKACPVAEFTTLGRVVLYLTQPLPEFSRIEVTFGGTHTTYGILLPKPSGTNGTNSTGPQPATNRNDANIYLSGAVTPAENAKPSYNIDSFLNYTLFQRGNNSLLASGQVITDNRPTADPDCFTWSVGFRRNVPPSYGIEWDFAGMQMDKKANAMNFVSAPKFIFNINRNFKQPRTINGQSYLESWLLIGMDLQAGLEFGDNFRDGFNVTNNRGLRWFLRGVPGVNAYLALPNRLHFKKINISSTYTARIPTTDELFLETRRHTSTPIPLLASNVRHYVLNDIQFMIADYFGFEIKHRYGSLPPTFTLVDNQVAVGLVVQVRQGKPAQ